MHRTDSLKPQDVLVACRLFSLGESRGEWTYASLASDVGLSTGEAHASVDRCRRALLVTLAGPGQASVLRKNLRDLLLVVVPRIYITTRSGTVVGMPTSTSAPVLARHFDARSDVAACVWPGDGGGVAARGESLAPIYPTAARASARDPVVYELLALADVMRVGAAVDKTRAAALVGRRLGVG